MARPAMPWLKPAIFIGALAPLAALAYRAATNQLGANPISEALNVLGLTALVFLMLALAPTPLKALFGWTWPVRVRRMLGLYAFFYAALHFCTYLFLDQGLRWPAIWADLTKRKFIYVGFAALLLLIPLAITSTDAMVRRLGFVRWKRLHRLAYLATGLGVIHFVWRVKKDVREPVAYGAVLAILLAIRALDYGRKALGRASARKHETGSAPGA